MIATNAKPFATDGTGNVCADLSLPNADQEMVKAWLTLQTHRLIGSAVLRRRKPLNFLCETATGFAADAQLLRKLFDEPSYRLSKLTATSTVTRAIVCSLVSGLPPLTSCRKNCMPLFTHLSVRA